MHRYSITAQQFLSIVLFAILAQFAEAKQVVFIFHNGDPKQDVKRGDYEREVKASKAYKGLIEKTNPEFEVQIHSVQNTVEIKNIIKTESQTLRGIVFIGHGSSTSFYLNKEQDLVGLSAAYLLEDAMRDSKLAQKFTVYFLACKTSSDLIQGFAVSFFMQLSETFIRRYGHRTILEVIAHQNATTLNGALAPMSKIYRLMRDKIGRMRILPQIFKETPSPTTTLFRGTIGTSLISLAPIAMLLPGELGQSIGAAALFSGIGIQTFAYVDSKHSEKIADRYSNDGIRSGSANDFLLNSFENHSVTQCRELLE